jgi:hypothetical protein
MHQKHKFNKAMKKIYLLSIAVLLLTSAHAQITASGIVVKQTSGKVGIGTATPEHLLHLYGDQNQPLKLERTTALGVWFDLKNTLRTWTVGTSDSLFGIYDRSVFKHRLAINTKGFVGIGTTAPKYALDVVGSIHATGTVTWPDFVFEKAYALPSLNEVEQHIKSKGHLINVPSAAEVNRDGVDMVAMDARLLQKIEELTLYIIEQEKRIKALEANLKN